MIKKTKLAVSVGGSLVSAALAAMAAGGYTDVKPYAVSVSPEYVVQPLLSVAERVPRTSNPLQEFQMVGIPDGLGAHKASGGNVVLYMNHEFGQGVLSQPLVGGPTNRGAFVSRFVLDRNARVCSGDLAYNVVVDEENGISLPVPQVGNTTPAFSRFCSGSLMWQDAGFDRPIYFCGEESGSPSVFDGKGGLAVAIFDNELHTLPWMGRFSWENAVVQPKNGSKTVVMGLEDGPASPNSQLWMFVGDKVAGSPDVLARNGLRQGKLYTLVSTTPGMTNEVVFTNGTINATWVEIPNAAALTDAQLEAAADAVGAFGFVRVEDGAFNKKNTDEFLFVTTGALSNLNNRLGRIYRLELNKQDPTGPCQLSLMVNAEVVDALGGDTAFSPDNVDTSKEYFMVQEDGTADTRPEMTQRAREGSIWRFELDPKKNFAATRVAELNPPGTVGNTNGIPPVISAGVWEASGIIDASEFFGGESWLFDVQAHSPTLAPAPGTVEDGQLLLLKRASKIKLVKSK
jgi:hypothetical protein